MIVLVMVAASLTLLPAFLGLAGHRVAAVEPVGRTRRAPHGPPPRSGGGAGISTSPATPGSTRPAALPSLARRSPRPCCRCDSASPTTARSRRTGPNVGPTTWSPTGFGPGSNGPLLVAVDVTDDAGVVDPLRRAVAADRGVASVTPPEIDAGGGRGHRRGDPDDRTPGRHDRGPRSSRLRDDVLPSAPRRRSGPARTSAG